MSYCLPQQLVVTSCPSLVFIHCLWLWLHFPVPCVVVVLFLSCLLLGVCIYVFSVTPPHP